MLPPPPFSTRCEGGTDSKSLLDHSLEWGTLLTKIKAVRGTESRLPRHCGAGLFAVSPTSSECRFMICHRRGKKSRASVELWERAQKLCLVRALLRAHSRKNRSTSFASCTWLSMDLPTRYIRNDQHWSLGLIRRRVRTVCCRSGKSRS